jgi:hypothetical protein
VKLLFLVGSGVSLGAGLPSVTAITEQVLSGRNDEVLDFLREVKGICDDYYGAFDPGRETNYEDLAFVAQQIVDAIPPLEYENPALGALIDRFTMSSHAGLTLEELARRARDASDHVHATVGRMLNAITRPLDYLAPILDAFEDGAVRQLDVFSLNHDLVLETALEQRRIAFSDGFEEDRGTLRLWSDTFRHPSRRLFKLHGSIDWYRYDLDVGDWSGPRIARPIGDPRHASGPNGEDLGARGSPREGRPEFLVGTFNKILGYPSGIYADQHAHFHESLREAEALIAIGYGFRDKAINGGVIAWAERPGERRLVIVHPSGLPIGARGPIEHKWLDWTERGLLANVPSRLEETSWPEIRDAIMGRPAR